MYSGNYYIITLTNDKREIIIHKLGRLRLRVTEIVWYEELGEASISIQVLGSTNGCAVIDFVDEEERDAYIVELDEVCLI